MRDIPPGEGRCRPLAPRVSAQCPATVGFVSEFSARTGETRPVAKPNARRGSRETTATTFAAAAALAAAPAGALAAVAAATLPHALCLHRRPTAVLTRPPRA